MKYCFFLSFLFFINFASAEQTIESFEAEYQRLSVSTRLLESATLLPELREYISNQRYNENKAKALILTSKIYLQYDAYLEAIQALDKATKLVSENYPVLKAKVELAKAKIDFSLNRYHLAIETIDNNLSLLKQDNMESYANAVILKGRALFMLGSFHKSVTAFQEVKSNFSNQSKSYTLASVYIAQTALKQGQIALAKQSLNDIRDIGFNTLVEEEKLELRVINLQLAMQEGQFSKVITQARQLLKHTLDTRFLSVQINLQDILAKSYLQIGDYKAAFTYMQRHNLTLGALSAKKRANKLLKLETFNNLEKQKQRVRFLEKEAELAKIQMDKQRILQNQIKREQQLKFRKWAAVSVLTSLLSVILYYLWHRRRVTKELKLQVRERTKELELKTQMLEKLSHTDSLTGLYNRHYLNSIIGKEVASVKRNFFQKPHATNSLAVALIDIDHFKKINDTYGHSIGDKVLEHFSTILKNNVRETDYLIRWGGEEFLLILRDCDMTLASKIVDNIRRKVTQNALYLSSNEKVNISISIGLAPYPFVSSEPSAFDWEDVIEIADFALYTAKYNQRNAWVAITEHSISLTPSQTLLSIAEAIEDKQLMVTSNIEKELSFSKPPRMEPSL